MSSAVTTLDTREAGWPQMMKRQPRALRGGGRGGALLHFPFFTSESSSVSNMNFVIFAIRK